MKCLAQQHCSLIDFSYDHCDVTQYAAFIELQFTVSYVDMSLPTYYKLRFFSVLISDVSTVNILVIVSRYFFSV
jgi:hypothetical protein